MGNPDIRDDCRVGLTGDSHASDFAEMIHAHFDHGRLGCIVNSEQRFRHTDFIIQVALGLYGGKLRSKHRIGHFFRGGFADAACQANHLYTFVMIAMQFCNIQKCLSRIFDFDIRHSVRQIPFADNCRGTVRDSGFAKVVPVKAVAFDRHIQSILRHLAAVYGDGANFAVLPAKRTACTLFYFPKRQAHKFTLSRFARQPRARHNEFCPYLRFGRFHGLCPQVKPHRPPWR